MRYHGGHEYHVFRITPVGGEEDGGDDADHARPAPVWLEPAGEPTASVERVLSNAVAASGCELFHTGAYDTADGVAEVARVTGSEATRGRSPHTAGAGEIRHTYEHTYEHHGH